MEQSSAFTYPSSSGLCQIHARQWLPERRPYRGIVQLSHGVTEHIGRFEEFARFLAGRGYVVVGNDHLGHGLSVASPSDLGFFPERDGWTHVTNDLRTLTILTQRAFPNLPVFLFGHSMGSFLVRTYLIRFPGAVDGAVLCGTGYLSAATLQAGKFLCTAEKKRLGGHGKSPLVSALSFDSYNKHFRPNRTESDWLSVNTANVDAYLQDPLCGFKISTGLMLDMLRGVTFNESIPNLRKMDCRTPVLFLSGQDDPVGDFGKGVRRSCEDFRRVGMQDVGILLYPGMRHEPTHEDGRQAVFDDIDKWLTRHIEKNDQGVPAYE